MKTDKPILTEVQAAARDVGSITRALWERYDTAGVNGSETMDMLSDADNARKALAYLEKAITKCVEPETIDDKKTDA